uniref:Matrix-remodeling-associated protein 7 helical domain-containing protein n=1 Tax=Monopterus albus TaxID=43700 RepID=A0A3Q3JGU3_MONAL
GSTTMDLTFILSAIIFTLLAIVVATSLFSGSSSTGHFTNARSYFGHTEDPRLKSYELNIQICPLYSFRIKIWCWYLIGVYSVLSDEVESSANDSLKYIPGKARSHHLQMMMSKNELEEEQRVQREQLAAIFQLLKDNKETFGEVSDGDIEEQLRLYSI